MALHLLKVCVGINSAEQLVASRATYKSQQKAAGLSSEMIHSTRYRPRRAMEILDGGSLYWIIRGHVCARQRILRFDEIQGRYAGKNCGIVLDLEVVLTNRKSRRPLQGWRYLENDEIPPDIIETQTPPARDADGETDQMVQDLRSLGLI